MKKSDNEKVNVNKSNKASRTEKIQLSLEKAIYANGKALEKLSKK